jgi:hypothetical protein
MSRAPRCFIETKQLFGGSYEGLDMSQWRMGAALRSVLQRFRYKAARFCVK